MQTHNRTMRYWKPTDIDNDRQDEGVSRNDVLRPFHTVQLDATGRVGTRRRTVSYHLLGDSYSTSRCVGCCEIEMSLYREFPCVPWESHRNGKYYSSSVEIESQ